jgi:hypothetical protein
VTSPRPPCDPAPRLRAVIGLLALAALAACANPRADLAAQAPDLFVGMPKQTLLSCAGVPERSAAIDNLEFFTYTSRRLDAYPSSSAGLYGGLYRGRHAYPWGYGLGYGFPATGYDVREQSCEATFTIRNGTVERLVYGGDAGSGASRLSQCYSIVENCLALAERQPRISVPSQQPAPAPAR